jgi:hypothetical protein
MSMQSPRKSWITSRFTQSEVSLRVKKRSQLKDGVHMQKKLNEITALLEDILDTIGASYHFNRKRDRLMTRFTRGWLFSFYFLK